PAFHVTGVQTCALPISLRAWKAARACEVRGVPTPRHVAFVLEGALLPRRGTVLMEHLAGVSMVHRLFEAPTPPAPAARRALARELGRAPCRDRRPLSVG